MSDERDMPRDATRTGARPSQAPTRAGDLQPGELIHDTYRLDKLIARGGMGAVYKATNVHTSDTVAVKVVRADLAGDDMIRELFRREAMALRKVRHPAVVAYEGVLGDADGRLYLVMEYVDGPSLGSLTSKSPLSPSEVRRLGRALAEGLAAAHDQGVVHRDLAPDNVVLRGGRLDQPVLIDFGLAKRTDSGASSVIGSAFAGKLDYCSPEQCGLFGGQVDARTDIYSLGLTLAAAAAGRAVPMGSSLAYAVKAREHEPDLSSVPDELRADLMPLLQPDPARRVQNMRDVFVTVPTRVSNSDSLMRPGGASAAPYRPPGSHPPGAAPAPSVAPVAAAAGGRGAGRPLAIAAAVALLLAAGGGAYWFTRPPAAVTTTAAKEDPEATARARAAEERRLAEARRADEEVRARIERERVAADAARAAAERARAAEAAKADQSRSESAKAEAAKAEAAKAEAARAEAAKAEAARAEAARADAARAEAARAEAARAEAAKAEAAKAEAAKAEAARTDVAKAEAAKAEAAKAEAARVEADLRAAERARATTEEAARRQTEQEARDRAAAEEAGARFGEAERKRAQVALTGIGHDTGGVDGSFGPRSRQMIGDWQRANGQPSTGYLTRPQYEALQRAAAGPLARYEAEQKRLEEEAKRRAAEAAARPPEPAGRTTTTTTATTKTTAAATPGQVPANWAGQVCVTGSSTSTGCGPARLTMSGGRGSGDWNFKGVKLAMQVSINLDASGAAGQGTFAIELVGVSENPASPAMFSRSLLGARLRPGELSGGGNAGAGITSANVVIKLSPQ